MKDESYIAYRKEDNLYELHDPKTNKSYWLYLDGKGDIKLNNVTNYGIPK